MKSAHGTMIVWLQNDAGYQRWGPTEVRRKYSKRYFRKIFQPELVLYYLLYYLNMQQLPYTITVHRLY